MYTAHSFTLSSFDLSASIRPTLLFSSSQAFLQTECLCAILEYSDLLAHWHSTSQQKLSSAYCVELGNKIHSQMISFCTLGCVCVCVSLRVRVFVSACSHIKSSFTHIYRTATTTTVATTLASYVEYTRWKWNNTINI